MKKATELELAEAPEITLAGQKYKIPKIVARQNRVITPLVFSMLETFIRFAVAAGKTADAGGVGVTGLNLDDLKISEEEYNKLLRIAHAGLARTLPELSFEDFLDWEVETMELFGALFVIANQAGIAPKQGRQAARPLAPTPPAKSEGETAEPTGTQSQLKSPSVQDGNSTTSSTP